MSGVLASWTANIERSGNHGPCNKDHDPRALQESEINMVFINEMEIELNAIPTRDRGTPEELELLAAHIRTNGVRQKPVITIRASGIFCLHGNRRLEALKAIAKQDGVPHATVTVQLVIADEQRALFIADNI